jgi:hypothetical protein
VRLLDAERPRNGRFGGENRNHPTNIAKFPLILGFF